MNKKPVVTRIWLNGREFRRVSWPRERIVITWAVREVISPAVFRGTFLGRREI